VCSFGDECKFAHDQMDPPQSSYRTTMECVISSGSDTRLHASKVIVYFYLFIAHLNSVCCLRKVGPLSKIALFHKLYNILV